MSAPQPNKDARQHPRRRATDSRTAWLKRQAEPAVQADTTLADRALVALVAYLKSPTGRIE